MSTAWELIAGCAALTFAIKAAGPVALGGRELPARFASVITLLAPALLAALVASHSLANGRRLEVGSQTVGVLASGAMMLKTRSIPLCVVTAAIVTALVRAL
jgi:branched-subunit amino acid transport protein